MDIASVRLHNQQLAGTSFSRPEEIVHWLGAIQAQDYTMAKWAIGVRLPGISDKQVEQAIADGTILRTHVLRPTWHFVAAEDIHYLLELTAPNILRLMRGRHRDLGLTASSIEKSLRIIGKALNGQRHLTREELIAELENHGIAAGGERGAHYMANAELEGLICCGAVRGIKQTYALLSERVKKTAAVPREAALQRLARTYFASHAPATEADFSWWSGLSLSDTRAALESIRKEVVSETVDGRTYWFPETLKEAPTGLWLLPAFDEFLIAYKTREVTIAADLQPRAFTKNGIFRPTIVANGQTIGTWKRTVKKDSVQIETELFKPLPKKMEARLEKAKQSYTAFLDKNGE